MTAGGRTPPPAAASGPPAGQRVPFSHQQEFLRLVDNGGPTGPFGPRYTIVGGWRLAGPLDVGVLGAALADLVHRHEALRTRLVPGDEPYQQVWPAAPPPLAVLELPDGTPGQRAEQAERFLNEVEAQPVPIDRMPALQATLGRFDRGDAVLVLGAHHTAVDGWSMQVLARDLAVGYAARLAGVAPELPPVRPYREYVRWQRAVAPAAAAAREYWREHLRGARVAPVRMDQPRSRQRPELTSWYRFLYADDLRRSVLALAAERRASPFMVLMAAYLLHSAERTGGTDVVMPTFTPGRRPAWTHEMVGSFFHLVPLRVDLADRPGLGEVVARVRTECLAAYAHELSFVDLLAVAPELMAEAATEHQASCVFQVVQSPYMLRDHPVGPVRYTAMRRRLISQPVGSQIPDGALWAMELDPAGGIVGSVGYGRGQFDQSTIVDLVAGFEAALRRQLARP